MTIRSARHCAALAAGLLMSPSLWAAWIPLGPFGGAASVVANDPHSSKTFVAGTRNALIFRSGDAGETWTPLPFPAQLSATLNTLAIDPETRGVYLAGISSDLPGSAGLLRSTDAGAVWQRVADLRDQQVRTLAFKPTKPGIVAAGTDTGVFLSRDSGATWRRISPIEKSQLRPIVSLAFDPKDSNILYAGTPHLPWKTTDGGASWQPASGGMIDDSDVFSIQVDRNLAQRVFAGACSGIYRSMNSGEDWTRLARTKGGTGRTYFVVQDPQIEKTWFAGTTDGLVRSLDGGTSWESLTPFTTRSLAFDPGRLGRILIATDQAGLLRSEDNGKTWQPINNGFCNRRLLSLWTTATGVYTAVANTPDSIRFLHLSEEIAEWNQLPDSSESAELMRSSDADRPSVPACPPAPCRDVRDMVSVAGRLLAATSSGLMESGDRGVTWRSVKGALESDSIQAICIHPTRQGLLFAAKYGVIYRSLDAGRSWGKLPEQPQRLSSILKLVVVAGPQDRVFILTGQQGVWMLPLESRVGPDSADDSFARAK